MVLGIPSVVKENIADFISENGIKSVEVVDEFTHCLLNSKEVYSYLYYYATLFKNYNVVF